MNEFRGCSGAQILTIQCICQGRREGIEKNPLVPGLSRCTGGGDIIIQMRLAQRGFGAEDCEFRPIEHRVHLEIEREKVKSSVIYPGQEISKAILVRMEIADLQLSQETGIKGDNREKKMQTCSSNCEKQSYRS